MGSRIGDETLIVPLEQAEIIDRAAEARNADGSLMYCRAQYDADKHVFVAIKARGKQKKEAQQ